MLRKERAAGRKVKVTFSMPALEGVTALFLVGSFNDWNETSTPMVRGTDGGWSAALTLEEGWAYQYRFRDQDGAWHNDWAADSYVPNEFGTENSMVDLTDAAGPAPGAAAKSAANKPAAKTGAPRGKKKS